MKNLKSFKVQTLFRTALAVCFCVLDRSVAPADCISYELEKLARAESPIKINEQVLVAAPDGSVYPGAVLRMSDEILEVAVEAKDMKGTPLHIRSKLSKSEILRPGSEISVLGTDGMRLNAQILSIGNDGRAVVSWLDGNVAKKKTVPVQSLGVPQHVKTQTSTVKAAERSTQKPIDQSAVSFPSTAPYQALKEKGLLPTKDPIKVGNAKYTFSDIFEDQTQRLFAMIRVETEHGTKDIVAYHSGSQGIFRELPGTAKLWLDKAQGEHYLNLPLEVQESLANKLSVSTQKTRRLLPLKDLNGIITIAPSLESAEFKALRAASDYVNTQNYRSVSIVQASDRPLVSSKGSSYPEPSKIQLVDPKAEPNFTKPVRTFDMPTEHGIVKAEVYPSVGGGVQYTIMRDSKNRIWIADIGQTNPKMTVRGLRELVIDPGPLTMPLWEYSKQIPIGYHSQEYLQLTDYESTWKYLKEIPVIQRYYKDRGIPMP